MANETLSLSTNSSLLNRVKNCEPEAWERLVELYGPLVYHWAGRYGLRQSDAADVFQETFLAVSTAIGRFRRDRPQDSFRGWLWSITRNKINDHYRHKRDLPDALGGTTANVRMGNLPEAPPSDADDPAQQAISSALVRQVLKEVSAEFEPQTWQAFWRIAVEGDSTADVAAELGVTRGAVRQAKRRVLLRLRQELGE